MTILNYITDYLPKFFKVHPLNGKVAELVFHAEQVDKKLFCQEQFSSTRERAALGIPYQVEDMEKREHALNVLEIILCRHRQKEHGEDHAKRIELLKMETDFSDEEAAMIMQPEDWWNG
jgi:hypothetical protein